MKKTQQNPADVPLYLFHQGHNTRAYEFFGAHKTEDGAVFRVWAPRAKGVAVTGAFNGWQTDSHPMRLISDGIWEAEIPEDFMDDLFSTIEHLAKQGGISDRLHAWYTCMLEERCLAGKFDDIPHLARTKPYKQENDNKDKQ